MITDSEIGLIEAAMQRRLNAMPQLIRPYTTDFQNVPKHLLLTGARGSGKSTFLLHHAKGRRMLYFSADNPHIINRPLYDVVHRIFMAGYEGAIVDEVHFSADWSLHLKALHDDFPNHTIWASDSSSLVLRHGIGDLSRRYVPVQMPFMSFREFLFLETGKRYATYRLGEAELPIHPTADILEMFSKYRTYGTRPFYQNGDFEERFMAITDKILYSDVPFFIPHVTDNNLRLMRTIIGTLCNSAIPRLQVSSLCSDWGIGAEKLYNILNVMESVGLLRIIYPENNRKSQSIGAKIFFADPCTYTVYQGVSGNEREAFTALCFASAGYRVESTRDETRGDYLVSKDGNSVLIEVGGHHKKPKSSDFVIRDNIDYPAGKAIPLWLLGMMW